MMFDELEWAVVCDSLGNMEKALEKSGSTILIKKLRSAMNKISIAQFHGAEHPTEAVCYSCGSKEDVGDGTRLGNPVKICNECLCDTMG